MFSAYKSTKRMSKKTELKKQLEDLYFDGLINDRFLLTKTDVLFSENADEYWYADKVVELEHAVYDREIKSERMYHIVPFKNALKRYKEITESKLYKVLEEN